MALLQERNGLSKGRVIMMLLALYLSVMCTMADMLITPIANEFYTLYADAPSAIVSLGVTGTCLSAMPFMLLSGWMCDHFNKKTMMVVGFAIYMVAGLFGAAVENVYYWVAMRLLVGVAWGVTNSAAFAILSDFFNDDPLVHSSAVAGYSIAISVVGSLLAFLGGVLAQNGWSAVYQGYWASIPVFILLLIFLPSFPAHTASAEETDEAAAATESKGWMGRLLPLLIMVIVGCCCFYEVQYMGSLYVEAAGIGDSTYSGTMISFLTLGGMVGAPLYPVLKKKLGIDFAFLPGIVLEAVCFLLMAFFPSQLGCLVFSFLIGMGNMCFYSHYYSAYAEVVPADKIGVAGGLIGFCEAMGNFGCSYVLMGLISATNGTAASVWWIFGAGFIVVGIFGLFIAARNKGKKAIAA